MKIIINEEKLLEYMRENGVKNYSQLCSECGISLNTFYCTKYRKSTSKETFWLIADYLGCHVEEIQKVDWEI